MSAAAGSPEFDFCVIGGGIVGLATAMVLRKREPRARIVVLEKESRLAVHQSGHNSGVIHAGVYYQPGSLKARLCAEGARATKAFCQHRNIPFETCGKLIVATDGEELARMEVLGERAHLNGIVVERLGAAALGKVEPSVAGVGALLVPSTGIVDYRRVCEAIAAELCEQGVQIRCDTTVTAIREEDRHVVVSAEAWSFRTSRLVACAGLQSDRLARLADLPIRHRIVPFRGEYYLLPASRAGIVRHLIYPVPDPELPFLGIHLTRMVDGSITVGPNAVLGFAREGYSSGRLDPRDAMDMATFSGFWRMARDNWRSGLREFANSFSKRGYLEQCRKYCPDLNLADLATSAAGIRAQAVLADGTLVHDFLFVASERMLHVCNAPSPAATSAIPIGAMVVERLLDDTARESSQTAQQGA